MEKIISRNVEESNSLKEKVCENCMDKLKGVLSDGEMQQFREAFYATSERYILKRKDSVNGNR